MSLSYLFYKLKGGPGSGNRGHAGVPGKRGGSAPKGSSSYISPLKNKDVLDQMTSDLNELWDSNPDLRYAMIRYTTEDFGDINGALRTPDYYRESRDELQLDNMDRTIEKLDRAFEEHPPLKHDIVVERRSGFGLKTMVLDKLKPGDVFQDNGFVSTTLNHDAFDNVNMRIFVKKGNKGIYLDPISEYPGEQEVLLLRGSKFKFLGVGSDGMYELEVTD